MITDTTAKSTYTIASGVTAYAIGFLYEYNVDDTPQIKVATYKGNLLSNVLVYNTDYTISANGLNVNLVSGYDVGDTLVIIRDIPNKQQSDYHIGRIDPDQIEKDFDLAVERDQQLQAQVDILSEMPADHEERIASIESKIPAEATITNKLADKAWVTSSINTKAATLQPKITNSAKLASDLVYDSDQTHKFVTSAEKTTWNAKQNALTTAQLNAVNSGVTSTVVGQVTTNKNNISSLSSNKLDKNASITGATKCKITYDSKGLVTGGANISTADLTNVNINSPTDGQVLAYDNASSKWVNRTSSVTVAFDGITGQPRSNTNLADEFDKYALLTGATFTGTVKTKFSTQYPTGLQHTNTLIPNNYSSPASDVSVVTNALMANDGSFVAYESMSKTAAGVTSASLYVRNRANSSGSNRNGGISVSIDSSGNVATYAPTPNATSNTTQIATTAWVKSYATGRPNWDGITEISSGYTATKNGYVYATQAGYVHCIIKVNGTNISGTLATSTGNDSSIFVGLVPINTGDVVTVDYESTCHLYFVPMKNL